MGPAAVLGATGAWAHEAAWGVRPCDGRAGGPQSLQSFHLEVGILIIMHARWTFKLCRLVPSAHGCAAAFRRVSWAAASLPLCCILPAGLGAGKFAWCSAVNQLRYGCTKFFTTHRLCPSFARLVPTLAARAAAPPPLRRLLQCLSP